MCVYFPLPYFALGTLIHIFSFTFFIFIYSYLPFLYSLFSRLCILIKSAMQYFSVSFPPSHLSIACVAFYSVRRTNFGGGKYFCCFFLSLFSFEIFFFFIMLCSMGWLICVGMDVTVCVRICAF